MEWLRGALIALGALASVATSAAESGDRANGGDGDCIILCEDDQGPTCPPGEECSDDTPTGLYFTGMTTGDVNVFGTVWPRATALGGEQRIQIWLDSGAQQPLGLPFDASVTSGALSVVSAGSASVVVRGESPSGAAKLRITEQGTDLLYDRIDVESYAVAEMEARPAGQYTFSDLLLFDDPVRFAVAVGGEARLTVAMFASNGARVVDRSMSVAGSPGVTPDSGYVDTVVVRPIAAGPIEIAASTASLDATMTVDAVARPDEIVADASELGVRVGQRRTFCFRAWSGDAVVLGVEWGYAATSRVEVDDEAFEDGVTSSCVQLAGLEVGAATLTVTASGAVASFVVDVIEDQRSGARPQVIDPEELGLAGERAQRW